MVRFTFFGMAVVVPSPTPTLMSRSPTIAGHDLPQRVEQRHRQGADLHIGRKRRIAAPQKVKMQQLDTVLAEPRRPRILRRRNHGQPCGPRDDLAGAGGR